MVAGLLSLWLLDLAAVAFGSVVGGGASAAPGSPQLAGPEGGGGTQEGAEPVEAPGLV